MRQNTEDIASRLNDQQVAAITAPAPVVVMAGAGSGKTQVLSVRIAREIEQGVPAGAILALTFTNKAARSMKERVAQMVGERSKELWISTFHKMCVGVLRKEAQRLGYKDNWVIYDTDDAKAMLGRVISELGLDPKIFVASKLAGVISAAKNDMASWQHLGGHRGGNYYECLGRIYRRYGDWLKAANAMDFDDLLTNTYEVLLTPALQSWQERYRSVFIDEYQDTNRIQNEIIWLLTRKHRQLFVVGDVDQSIYGFRGARWRNLLDLENRFPEAKRVVLEYNYRSAPRILACANSVISNNNERPQKMLRATRPDASCVHTVIREGKDELASAVAKEVQSLKRSGVAGSEIAVLYRTNVESRAYEEAFLRHKIAHQVIGATRFYDRKEIRDVLAYARLVHNPFDLAAFSRVANWPTRGIGAISLEIITEHASARGLSFIDALGDTEGLSTPAEKGARSLNLILRSLVSYSETYPPSDLIAHIADETGITSIYQEEGSKRAQDRLENIEELCRVAKRYSDLASFLASTKLYDAQDDIEEQRGEVCLLTIHTSKGLEWKAVFVVSLHDGGLPHFRSLEEKGGVEEERRLCYVALTRAKDHLYLCADSTRGLSQFLYEMPEDLVGKALPDPDAHLQRRVARPHSKARCLGS